jgi:DNA-binding NarL/FixJ family response regulator
MRVVIASASVLARGGMEALLAAIPAVSVVGSATAEDAGAMTASLRPDAVVFDAGLGDLAGLEGITRLADEGMGPPVVVLTAQSGATHQLLSFGAAAVLPSDVDAVTLAVALEAVVRGLTIIPRREAGELLPAGEPVSAKLSPPTEALTARELQVVQAMAGGLTNRQIALRLRISEHTVKFHVAAILSKLESRSRAEAVARAMQLGLILV